MDRPVSPHRLVNPEGMSPGAGFSHVVLPAAGRTVYLGGQTAQQSDGSIAGATITEQMDVALGNVVSALAYAQGSPEHLVSMTICTTDMAAYRAALPGLGPVHRRHLGRHYPAIALLGVAALFDPAALVELVCVAVIPMRA